jgi:hypothetical protein
MNDSFLCLRSPNQEGTSRVNANSTRRVVVEPGGTGVVAHVGLDALGRVDGHF